MPIKLGNIIDALQLMPPDERVFFDFCGLEPTSLDSYRGYYDQLALGYRETSWPGTPMTVSVLLAECKQAVGRTYTGYKGGNFTMDRSTPVWVANHGMTGSTAIIGLREVGYGVVIDTRFED